MRKLGLAVLAVALWAAPRPASAGWLVEGSLGFPWQTSPSSLRQQTNIMVAPGYSFAMDIVAVQLGVLANLANVDGSSFNWSLRPMVMVQPPVVPLFGRVILDVANLGTKSAPLGSSTVTTFGFGGGFSFGVAMARILAEVDYLPRSIGGTSTTVIEGRVGVVLSL